MTEFSLIDIRTRCYCKTVVLLHILISSSVVEVVVYLHAVKAVVLTLTKHLLSWYLDGMIQILCYYQSLRNYLRHDVGQWLPY